MNLHRCLHCYPYQTPLYGAVPRSPGGWEDHTMGMWLPARSRGLPILSPNIFPPMLRLYMDCHRPKRHILPVLRALYPKTLHFLVGITRSCHPSPIHCLQLRSRRPMYYPASPTPSSVINYSPPPWRNRRWQGASCSVKYRAQACCIGGTMGEGGFPSPI